MNCDNIIQKIVAREEMVKEIRDADDNHIIILIIAQKDLAVEEEASVTYLHSEGSTALGCSLLASSYITHQIQHCMEDKDE